MTWPELWAWRSEPVDVAKLRAERDTLSRLLRGMARRLRNYRRLAVSCPDCGDGPPYRFVGDTTECSCGAGWPTDQRFDPAVVRESRPLAVSSAAELAQQLDLIAGALGLNFNASYQEMIGEANRLRRENRELTADVAEFEARRTTGGPHRGFTHAWTNRSSRPPTAPSGDSDG